MQPLSPEAYANMARRPLDVEDYFDILRRHKAWIFAPLFAALVVAFVVAFLWPNTYTSRASIRVVPPTVPESFVRTNVNQAMSQRIDTMYQTITSRTSLTNMITSLNLYPKERANSPLLDVIEGMKGNIRLGQVMPLGSTGQRNTTSAFTISFQYPDRYVAQKVTQELVSRFLSENAAQRTDSSRQTTDFLNEQFEAATKELESIEAKLANFRQTFQGRLPDQAAQNQMQLNNLENRIANINAGLSRLSQEKLLAESQLNSTKTARASLLPSPDQVTQRQKNETLILLDREILQLESGLTGLRERYTEKNPDVQRVATRLASAKAAREKVAQQELEQKQSEPARAPRMDPAFEREARNYDAVINRLEAEIRAKDMEMETQRKAIQGTETTIRGLQSRIEAAPISQQQYAEVIRDREVAMRKYEEFNQKRQSSVTAEQLEKRGQGETLEQLDAASLPEAPTRPDRPFIIGTGTALGFVIGLALAAAREAKDTSLKNLKDVRAYTQLTILGSIPLLENDLVVTRRKRLGWLAWSTASLLGLLIMGGSVLYYYSTKT